MQRSIVILLVVVLAVAACTGTPNDPAPTAGPTGTAPTSSVPAISTTGQVAVVVDPVPWVRAGAVEQALGELPADVLDGRTVRVVTADDPSFVGDLARFFTMEGFALVCVLGPTAADVVREIAVTSPTTRFCAAPAAATDLPDNVLPVDVRIEDLGYVAGAAFGTDLDAGPVTIVPSPGSFAPVRLREGLRQGLAAAGLRPPAVTATRAVFDPQAAADVVADALGTGTLGVFALAGPLDTAVRDAVLDVPVTRPPPRTPGGQPTDQAPARPQPTSPTPTGPTLASLVAGPDLLDDDEALSEQVLLTYRIHLDRAVRVAMARAAEGWDPRPASIGVAEGAISVTVNPDARAAGTGAAVGSAIAALRNGDVVFGPTEDATPPS